MTRNFIKFAVISVTIIIYALLYSKTEAKTINNILGVKTYKQASSSKIVIDTDQNPDYQISVRENPDRIVIEIKNSLRKHAKDIPENIRYNVLSNNKLQLVHDLKAPFTIKKNFVFLKENKTYRLVVEIIPKGNSATSSSTQETFIPIPKIKETRKIIIAIDAGHGGHDPGAIGYHGSKEKDITLHYAFALKHELENSGRYTVILTRKDDTYVDLRKRVQISRQAKADMFLSIHADSHNNRQMKGFSIYTLSETASDKEAEALAQKENNAGILNEVDMQGDTKDITELLIDLVQRETKNLSAELAENILDEIKTKTELLQNNPHRFAGFKVLTAPDIPSTLIELGYLSNKKEETMLLSQIHKKELAQAIVTAIDKHFRKYPVD